MKCNQRHFAITVVALIALSLLVLSVSATASVEGPVMGKGTPTITGGFANFAAKHAMSIEGDWYLTHPLNKKTLFEYIECEKPYLQKNPDTELVLSLEGHGWFGNCEVVAKSDGKNVVVMQDVIDRLLPEIKANQLQGMGVTNSRGKWVDMIWGALESDPTPYFLNFAKNHAIRNEWRYYLIPCDKDAVVAYIESEVMHLAQFSSNAIETTSTPGLKPDYKKGAVVISLRDPESVTPQEVLVAETLATDSGAFEGLADKSVYTIAKLQNHPEKYTGVHIVWKGQYSVVCINVDEINKLLPNISDQTFNYMAVKRFYEIYGADCDHVWSVSLL
jgi:hypothetical protein